MDQYKFSRDTGLGVRLGRSHSLPAESMRRLTPDEHETNFKFEHARPFPFAQTLETVRCPSRNSKVLDENVPAAMKMKTGKLLQAVDE